MMDCASLQGFLSVETNCTPVWCREGLDRHGSIIHQWRKLFQQLDSSALGAARMVRRALAAPRLTEE